MTGFEIRGRQGSFYLEDWLETLSVTDAFVDVESPRLLLRSTLPLSKEELNQFPDFSSPGLSEKYLQV